MALALHAIAEAASSHKMVFDRESIRVTAEQGLGNIKTEEVKDVDGMPQWAKEMNAQADQCNKED